MRYLKALAPFFLMAVLLYGTGLFASAAPPPAEPAGPLMASPSFDLSWDVVEAGGGNTMTSVSFTLLSTTGQPAITNELSSTSYKLISGYWAGASPWSRLFLSLLRR
ncbi:MAG TPA: hypothetical protein DEP84_24245 [Chloroflexi bacterium]|nr:hypothetical protein [Chloroflexota bacterium]